MSELIQKNDNRATIRWKLLTSASALALTAYVSAARAEDASRPTIWIELGGQVEQIEGAGSPFTAPFMSVTPTPPPYKGISFPDIQHPARLAFGEEGKITFQPEDSDWVFSAGIRYGRSHKNRHVHHQMSGIPPHYYLTYSGFIQASRLYASPFADARTLYNEHHAILDFSAGRDVGLGMLGHDGISRISAGVRIAQFTARSSTGVYAIPSVEAFFPFTWIYFREAEFKQYRMQAQAERSFEGIGPSLSWDASAPLAGNASDGELMLDWGLNAAMLFGRQKAKTAHSTHAYQLTFPPNIVGTGSYTTLYQTPRSYHSTRSRRVIVPNLGGYAAISVKYPNVKFSLGYRYDAFLKAMDTGIDATKKSNLTFNGPYVSISVGF